MRRVGSGERLCWSDIGERMTHSLLSKNGFLMSENGKLIFTDDPAKCDCCDNISSSIGCPPGCMQTNGVEAFGAGECDPLEDDIFPNSIVMTPDPACDSVTINFTIENQTGGLWEGEAGHGFDDAYVYLAISAASACAKFTYASSSPTYTQIHGSGQAVGGTIVTNGIYQFDWDISLADGATTDFSVTLDIDQCLCDGDVIEFEVGVIRGCRGFIQAECCPTGSA